MVDHQDFDGDIHTLNLADADIVSVVRDLRITQDEEVVNNKINGPGNSLSVRNANNSSSLSEEEASFFNKKKKTS